MVGGGDGDMWTAWLLVWWWITSSRPHIPILYCGCGVENFFEAADSQERFSYDGEIYKIPETSIRPQARHKGDVARHIMSAFNTSASMEIAADLGLGQQDDVERCQEAGFDKHLLKPVDPRQLLESQ